MTVVILKEEAYGNEIQRHLEERLDERLSMGAIQAALKRMEEKGYLISEWGEASQKRGGKRKRIYQATSEAMLALQQMKDIRAEMWSAMGSLKPNLG